jgi:hypothetical protein
LAEEIELGFNWYTKSFKERKLVLKIDFDRSDQISEKQMLKMNFIAGLQSKKSGLAMTAGTELEVKLINQFSNESDAAVAKSASDAIQAALGINLILLIIFQVVVGKVLKLMWPLYFTL